MGELKTSYIFTKPEILFLLCSIPDTSPTYPLKYILNKYLLESVASQEAIDGLEYKKLLLKSSGKISLEPIIDLLTRSALSSNKLWIINENDIKQIIILKSKDMYLHIKSYALIDGAWRITPYRNVAEMAHELDDIFISDIKVIDDNGDTTCITPQNDFTWLEG